MKTDILVYISGPITASAGHSIEQNVADAIAVFFRLIQAGITAFCPHLGALYPSAYAVEYDKWMAYDYAMLSHCTHILMLPRWETSKGARLERVYAVNHDIAFVTLEELLAPDVHTDASRGLCCMARHANAVAPWTCDCPCHTKDLEQHR